MNAPVDLPIRDIHLPTSVSWWPPGPGWWLLSLLCVMAALWVCWRYRQKKNQTGEPVIVDIRPAAIQQFGRICRDYHASDDDGSGDQSWKKKQSLAKQTSALLRTVLVNESHENIAGVTGQVWLEVLDQHFGLQQAFASDIGIALTQAPYQPNVDYDADRLVELVAAALGGSHDALGRAMMLEEGHDA